MPARLVASGEVGVEYLVCVGIRPVGPSGFVQPFAAPLAPFHEEIAEFRAAAGLSIAAERVHLDPLDGLVRRDGAADLLSTVGPLLELRPFAPGGGAVGVVDVEIHAVVRCVHVLGAALAAVDDRRRVGFVVRDLFPKPMLNRLGHYTERGNREECCEYAFHGVFLPHRFIIE